MTQMFGSFSSWSNFLRELSLAAAKLSDAIVLYQCQMQSEVFKIVISYEFTFCTYKVIKVSQNGDGSFPVYKRNGLAPTKNFVTKQCSHQPNYNSNKYSNKLTWTCY